MSLSRNRSVAIFLKPDALAGPYATIDAPLANDFFHSLLASLHNQPYLHVENLYHSSSILTAEKAFRQVTERASSEDAFREPLLQSSQCETRLLVLLQSYKGTSLSFPTKKIIQQAIAAFGFEIVAEANKNLSQRDIESIYGETLKEHPKLLDDLLLYLEHQQVCLILLEGEQVLSALQRIKTYVRYFLRYRQREQHLLENLIHVPDLYDHDYLLQLS